MNQQLLSLMTACNSQANGDCESNYFLRPEKMLDLFLKYDIKSFFDSGCKDRQWIKNNRFQEHGIKYTGGEISTYMINYLKTEFPEIDVIHHDCTTDQFPDVDLLFSSDVMIHLNNEDKLKFLRNFCNSNIKYLMMTDSNSNYTVDPVNLDFKYGSDLPFAHVYWNLSPWNFPESMEIINDTTDDARLRMWSREQLKPIIEKISL